MVKIAALPGHFDEIRKTFVYLASIILELGLASLGKRRSEALAEFKGLAQESVLRSMQSRH